MQLEDSSVLQTSSHNKAEMAAAALPEAAAQEGVHGGEMEVDTNSGEEKGRDGGGDEGEKIISFGGNRWPRQETLTLLKIRSDMDAVFRDSSLKGPLWEEVSRKLAELGYHRSAKKCKEKFENVYKYHKRTKETRSGKSEGKTYKFFDQLQALENQFTISYPPKSQPVSATTLPTRPSDNSTAISYVTTFPSTNPTIISPSSPTNATASNPRTIPTSQGNNNNVPYSMNLFSSTSTSSSTASDEDLQDRYRKKRKWKEYFKRLTRKVLAKQEEMQNKFLEAIDKRERELVSQQDAWRIQELARINREHEILVQERQTAAAKDAAVIAFLQKMCGQQNPTQVVLPQPPPPPPPPLPPLPSQVQTPHPAAVVVPSNNFEMQRMNNGHSANAAGTTTVTTTIPMSSSSRWPRVEVQALIKLRTSLESKYHENGPKAPLWEEISAGMQRLGYSRSAKRCKEKWENINKYFKKVKESNKRRRDDSKTCPYYDELDALYKEKGKNQNPFSASFENVKPNEMMEPLMVQPEQQWRPPPQYDQLHALEENNASQPHLKEKGEEEEEEELDDDNDEKMEDIEDDGDSVEDEAGSRYEIVTNKLSSADTTVE